MWLLLSKISTPGQNFVDDLTSNMFGYWENNKNQMWKIIFPNFLGNFSKCLFLEAIFFKNFMFF